MQVNKPCKNLLNNSSKKVKLQDVRDWLRKQQTYTLHKPIHKKFLQRETVVAGIDTQRYADLADLSELSNTNDKHGYSLCVIDVFSKYAWVVPIKDKMGKTVVIAFKSVLKSGRCPKCVQTDKGTEFENKEFQSLLKNKKIQFFTTENPGTKACIVKRLQRTLKTCMWKYFTHHCTLRYVDIIPNLVHCYNHAYHRSIKCAPVSVTLKNKPQVSENLYGKSSSKKVKPKFKEGNFVRINKTKRTFDKGYLPNWTQKLFQILVVVKTRTLITYKIKYLDDEVVKGTFYAHELQRVEKDQIYEIDYVLDHRKRKVGKKWVKEIKVHWKGYPSKFDIIYTW